jgi:IS605 OrfB family transposase
LVYLVIHYYHQLIITRKIEIGVDRLNEERYQRAWSFIRYLDDNLYKAANEIVSNQYFNHILKSRLQISHPDYRQVKKEIAKIDNLILETTDKNKKKELANMKKGLWGKLKSFDEEINTQFSSILNTSVQNTTYQVISESFPDIPSNIRTSLNSSIQKSYKAAFKELMFGKRSLPTYKKGIPIPFQFQNEFKKAENGDIGFAWLNDVDFHLRFGRDRSNNRSIIEKILNGVYKACDSSIQLKDSKLFLLLAVDIGEQDAALDKNICVGVDTGINFPLYAALNKGEARIAVGTREFLNVRQRLEAQKRELQRTLRESKGGRGRTHKLSALDRIGQKERNWVHTQNHNFTRSIINFALRNNAGVIKIEWLEGIGDDIKSKFLKRYWSYFELQNLMKYKAKYHGIEVKFINPKNTSKTCSYCGHLEEGQRLSQKEFQCKNPECSNKDEKGENKVINADYNGARNIAQSEQYI